jgi:hypothetical protein
MGQWVHLFFALLVFFSVTTMPKFGDKRGEQAKRKSKSRREKKESLILVVVVAVERAVAIVVAVIVAALMVVIVIFAITILTRLMMQPIVFSKQNVIMIVTMKLPLNGGV